MNCDYIFAYNCFAAAFMTIGANSCYLLHSVPIGSIEASAIKAKGLIVQKGYSGY